MEQLSSSVVSIHNFEDQLWGSNPHRLRRRMNIYTFNLFTNHCMDVEEIDEPRKNGLTFYYLQIGTFYLPEYSHGNC